MYPIYKVYSDRLRLNVVNEDNDTRQLGNEFHTDIDLGLQATARGYLLRIRISQIRLRFRWPT